MTICLAPCASVLEADNFFPPNVSKVAASADRRGRRKRRELDESLGLLNIIRKNFITRGEIMNVLILNGGPADGRGALHRRIKEIAENEGRSRGFTVQAFDLDGLDIKPCRGCFACWLKHPGTCAIKDEQEPVLRAMAAADIAIWITPVTFGGYSSALKKSLDRMIPNILPFFIKVRGEVHHPARYNRRQRLAVLGTLPSPDEAAAAIFRGLVERNAINLHLTETRATVIGEGLDEGALADTVRSHFAAPEVQS